MTASLQIKNNIFSCFWWNPFLSNLKQAVQWSFYQQWVFSVGAWSSLVIGDEGCIGPSRKLLCLCQTPTNYAAYTWQNSIVVCMFGRSSCSSPSLLKSSMVGAIERCRTLGFPRFFWLPYLPSLSLPLPLTLMLVSRHQNLGRRLFC